MWIIFLALLLPACKTTDRSVAGDYTRSLTSDQLPTSDQLTTLSPSEIKDASQERKAADTSSTHVGSRVSSTQGGGVISGLRPFLSTRSSSQYPDAVVAISPDQFEAALSALSSTFASLNEGNLTEEKEVPLQKETTAVDDDACQDEQIAKARGYSLDRGRSLLQLGIDYVGSGCRQRSYVRFRCARKDYSGMAGMNDAFASDLECTEEGELQIQNAEVRDDKGRRFESSETRQTADDKPCVVQWKESRNVFVEPCIIVQESFEKVDGKGKATFARIALKDVIWTPKGKAPFFEGGRADFILNDWTGTVTFKADGSLPTYSATNGTQTKAGPLPVGP